jgi:hypothetical protein
MRLRTANILGRDELVAEVDARTGAAPISSTIVLAKGRNSATS